MENTNESFTEYLASQIAKGKSTYDNVVDKHPELKAEIDKRLGKKEEG